MAQAASVGLILICIYVHRIKNYRAYIGFIQGLGFWGVTCPMEVQLCFRTMCCSGSIIPQSCIESRYINAPLTPKKEDL